ncbi:MAG TPA: glutathione S-transferase family protein [Burkholderiales bacterium]|jgi:glutathione S-transferase
MLKLYFARNTCALVPHIALEQAGAKYELVRIDFAKEEQLGAEYRKINPKARVPSLVTERGILTEVPAILLYLCQLFPQAKMAPLDDPFELARVQAFNSYLCSTVHIAHAHRMRGYRWVDASETAALDAMKRKVPQSVGECFQLIEREMLRGPWVMGDEFGICDMYLFTIAQWMEADGVDLSKIPKVVDHRRRVSEVPAVQRALAQEAA